MRYTLVHWNPLAVAKSKRINKIWSIILRTYSVASRCGYLTYICYIGSSIACEGRILGGRIAGWEMRLTRSWCGRWFPWGASWWGRRDAAEQTCRCSLLWMRSFWPLPRHACLPSGLTFLQPFLITIKLVDQSISSCTPSVLSSNNRGWSTPFACSRPIIPLI